ncbi:MAG: phosphopentomutase [Eubacteriales bacterium]|nr:phosphopentomutase [Eubacteriales bacterium]MDD4105476.1 phosphopentomutase [Eubacteriales bacterium]
MKKRVLLIVLDSVGVGALPDADAYGDEGANTIRNIANTVPLHLPHLSALGLGHIQSAGLRKDPGATGAFGKMAERSPGKDTTTGHWEMAGVHLSHAFPTFTNGFPEDFIQRFEAEIGTKTLGNTVASGTVIMDELGEEHLKTGYPIVYTSADSVFQIAANESIIPLEDLYHMCKTAREMLTGELAVGRVIARPFIGSKRGEFSRTPNRRDFSLLPHTASILDNLKSAGKDVLAVGKIEDIFAGRGVTRSNHAAGNAACIQATLEYMAEPFDGLCFVNLVDYDMVFGHRRDVQGYADALMAFDRALPGIQASLNEGDLLVITADHGCDPTFTGTDHTREYVPLLAWMKEMSGLKDLGVRSTFADVAATISEYFGLSERYEAASFMKELEE